MNLVTLDLETYFDGDYTLKKLTAEEYVRDPRFKTHCVGLKYNDDAAFVHADQPIDTWLKQCAVLCHHAHFDGLILSHHYGIRPAFWFDTLSMARLVLPHMKSHSLAALAEELGTGVKQMPYEDFKGIRDLPPELYNRVAEGCARDVELTHAIYKKLLPFVPKMELKLIDLTVRLFTEPALRLDVPRLEKYLGELREQKEKTLQALGVSKEDLQSSNKFAALLRQLDVEPPMKPSPTNPEKTVYAFAKTDEAMKELENAEDERVAALATARLGSKSTLNETRTERLLGVAGRGSLPVYLVYAGAHTLRWSGGDKLNLQNLPRGGEIRKSLLAPDGYVLVVIDLAQIELRVLSWLAGQQDVLDTLRAGKDVYCEQASRALGRMITKADKTERQLFKTAELGLGYGMGAAKFAQVLKQQGLEADAELMVKQYRMAHPMVTRLWKDADKLLQFLAGNPLEGMWRCLDLKGKRLYSPDVNWLDYTHLGIGADGEYMVKTRRGEQKMYGAKLVENIVQWLARNILAGMMLRIAGKYRIVMSTHDEVVYLARQDEAQEALDYGMSIMKTAPSWCPDLPLDAEGSYAKEYSK